MADMQLKEIGSIESAEDISAKYAALQAQYDADKKKWEADATAATSRASSAEQLAAQRSSEAERALVDKHRATIAAAETRLQATAIGLAEAKSIADRAEKEIARLHEIGDFQGAARAQSELGRAQAQAHELERAREDMEYRLKAAMESPAPKPAAAPLPADPIERIIATNNVTPRTAEWLRSNRSVASNERAWNKLMAAHLDAVADGVVPESDDYFARLETKTGIRKADEGETPQSAPAKKSSKTPPAAPVSRSNQSMNGRTTDMHGVELTPEEREAAKFFTDADGNPLGEDRYLARKKALIADGVYRSYDYR